METRITVSRDECPSSHSLGNQIARAIWGLAWLLLFRPTPRPCRAWRRLLLRLFGARIGRGVKVMPSVRIWAPWNLEMADESCLGDYVDCYCVDKITIGAHATVSQYSFLCTATHDASDPHMKLITAPIVIQDQAWICADVFVAPGVTIGQGTVVGARSSVFKDLPAWKICYGTPAKPVKERVVSGVGRSEQ